MHSDFLQQVSVLISEADSPSEVVCCTWACCSYAGCQQGFCCVQSPFAGQRLTVSCAVEEGRQVQHTYKVA